MPASTWRRVLPFVLAALSGAALAVTGLVVAAAWFAVRHRP
jgi:hypothetical protein